MQVRDVRRQDPVEVLGEVVGRSWTLTDDGAKRIPILVCLDSTIHVTDVEVPVDPGKMCGSSHSIYALNDVICLFFYVISGVPNEALELLWVL